MNHNESRDGKTQKAMMPSRSLGAALQLKRKMRGISAKGACDDHARGSIASYTGWLGWCDGQGLYDKYIRPLKKMGGV